MTSLNAHATTGIANLATPSQDSLTLLLNSALALVLSGAAAGITIGGDTDLYRVAADTLGTDDRFVVQRQANGDVFIQCSVSGQSQEQFKITSGPTGPVIALGGGSAGVDTNLYRSAADYWKTDDTLEVTLGVKSPGGVTTLVKAGTPSDGDFNANVVASGLLAVDTTNNKLYVRVGSTWLGVQLGAVPTVLTDLGTVGSGGTVNINAALGNTFKVTTTANNVTWAAPTNPTSGQIITIINTQSGYSTSSYTINAVWKVNNTANAFSSTSDTKMGVDSFVYNGTNWVQISHNGPVG